MTWAQIETEKTVTQTLSALKSDEAKPYLLHQAVMEAVTQYSTEMGIDAATFKARLDEKFSKYFEAQKLRKMTEKFGKNYATTLTEEDKKLFMDSLEKERNREFIQYAKLDQLLDSYAFKQIGNDPASAENWKSTIVLNLNRPKVLRFYARITSTNDKQYSKLQILSEINLIGVAWTDLGLEAESTFSDPLLKSWLKWYSANLPDNVEEVSLCNGTCIQEFTNWQELPQEEGMSVSENILNGLWLKISFNLRKMSFIESINEWQFEWDGSVVLLDANTKKIVSTYTILPETKTFRNLEQKILNSALASSMYRSPLDPLSKITKKIQETPRLNRLSRLGIQGHKHLGDVLSLMELLKKEGSNLNFELQIDLFTQKEAQLLCFYQGEEKSFTDLLSRVKELKSSHSYSLVNEFTGIHHVLKLIAE
jgi:hypothetical protein